MHARPFGCAAGAGTITLDGTNLSIEDASGRSPRAKPTSPSPPRPSSSSRASTSSSWPPPPRCRTSRPTESSPTTSAPASTSSRTTGSEADASPHIRQNPPPQSGSGSRLAMPPDETASRGIPRFLSFLSEGRFSCVLLHEEDLLLFLERLSRGVRIGTPLLFSRSRPVLNTFPPSFLVCVFIRLGLHLKDCVHSFPQGFPCLI